MLCEEIPAQLAAEWGLINRAVPAARLDATVDELVEKLAAKLPQTTRYAKQQLNFWRDLSWHETVNHARDWLALSHARRGGAGRGAQLRREEMTGLILVEREPEGPIATVLLNRPERLNALYEELMGALVEALHELDGDSDVRCVVLGGSERAFAAGADIGEMADCVRDGHDSRPPCRPLGRDPRGEVRRSSPPFPASVSAAAASSPWPAT